ncbi:ABC transporter ATP-binding protein [Pseudoxanthobacter sp.]|uniref:ABC transporter ATP-binding protein n=1 Tax=Pseudoxanthobacter sp. TaxID=1925742 RepID=UPI002FDF9854
MTTVLSLSGVTKTYGELRALDAITLAVPGNTYVSLLGPSGSGKTSLLRVIAGFEEPDAGSVVFDGRRIDRVAPHRRGIGFVFQNFALFPHLTVYDNVAFGLENRETGPAGSPAERRERVMAMIGLVGLDGLEGRGVSQISGGQRQRVALARTLVTEPRLVLLDEPLGALDANLRGRMREELRLIRERLGVTFLHVTGSETEALAMGDSVVVLNRGRIEQVADSDTVYNRPASADVAHFLNCYNIFDGALADGAFVGPAGRFALAPGAERIPGRPAYAVRQDRIAIGPADGALQPGEVGVAATFVASEYTGASLISLFSLDSGAVIEVEDHLSHRAPRQFQPQTRYGLSWKAADALIFA